MSLRTLALAAPSSFPVTKTRNFSSAKTSQRRSKLKKHGPWVSVVAAAAAAANVSKNEHNSTTKVVTFLGKGGSGKTTASVFAAQHYALTGLNTCLVIHSQDIMAEYLLNTKIGPSLVEISDNLSVVRLETTKMILEPLKRLKQADARLNLTQGVLEGVVGEELGVLPGMDSIFTILELERITGFLASLHQKKPKKGKYDIIVYDGISSEETLRIIGATSKAKLYLKYFRNLAEGTDLGRLAAPSFLRLVDDALIPSGSSSNIRTSSETWDVLDQILEKGSSIFTEPKTFGCYLVMDPSNPISQNSALRYWGCTIQSGSQISGALGLTAPHSTTPSPETQTTSFSPLPFALIPHLKSPGKQHSWTEIMSSNHSKDARDLLSKTANKNPASSVKFDLATKTVKLFVPGFDKSEIKLYQFRGGSELLVEAGDQRRVIRLPNQIQGKVGGAKYADRSLIVTMR